MDWTAWSSVKMKTILGRFGAEADGEAAAAPEAAAVADSRAAQAKSERRAARAATRFRAMGRDSLCDWKRSRFIKRLLIHPCDTIASGLVELVAAGALWGAEPCGS